MSFPLDMFGFKVKNPPQDFISGGEKLNSLMQICYILYVCYLQELLCGYHNISQVGLLIGLIQCIILP